MLSGLARVSFWRLGRVRHLEGKPLTTCRQACRIEPVWCEMAGSRSQAGLISNPYVISSLWEPGLNFSPSSGSVTTKALHQQLDAEAQARLHFRLP